MSNIAALRSITEHPDFTSEREALGGNSISSWWHPLLPEVGNRGHFRTTDDEGRVRPPFLNKVFAFDPVDGALIASNVRFYSLADAISFYNINEGRSPIRKSSLGGELISYRHDGAHRLRDALTDSHVARLAELLIRREVGAERLLAAVERLTEHRPGTNIDTLVSSFINNELIPRGDVNPLEPNFEINSALNFSAMGNRFSGYVTQISLDRAQEEYQFRMDISALQNPDNPVLTSNSSGEIPADVRALLQRAAREEKNRKNLITVDPDRDLASHFKSEDVDYPSKFKPLKRERKVRAKIKHVTPLSPEAPPPLAEGIPKLSENRLGRFKVILELFDMSPESFISRVQNEFLIIGAFYSQRESAITYTASSRHFAVFDKEWPQTVPPMYALEFTEVEGQGALLSDVKKIE